MLRDGDDDAQRREYPMCQRDSGVTRRIDINTASWRSPSHSSAPRLTPSDTKPALLVQADRASIEVGDVQTQPTQTRLEPDPASNQNRLVTADISGNHRTQSSTETRTIAHPWRPSLAINRSGRRPAVGAADVEIGSKRTRAPSAICLARAELRANFLIRAASVIYPISPRSDRD